LKGVNFMIITNVINHMKNKGSILLHFFFIMGFCDLLVGSTLNLKKKKNASKTNKDFVKHETLWNFSKLHNGLECIYMCGVKYQCWLWGFFFG
jgi:hypothetical protein